LQKCWSQARVNTPRPVWNPDVPQTIPFFDTWQEVPGLGTTTTASRPNGRCSSGTCTKTRRSNGLARRRQGLQLVEAAHKSWKERRWIDIPALKV